MSHSFSLQQLGWRPAFAQRLTLEDLERGYPARVSAVHRSGPIVLSERGEASVLLPRFDTPITVGDWLLIEHDAPRPFRLVERQSLVARLAAGTETKPQPIAANLDTVFVVTSCDEDFSLSRLERYLAVVHAAQVEPVVVLTKADLCADVDARIADVAIIAPTVQIVAIDATSSASRAALEPWLSSGQTVALVGSSGVGKSTLINSLIGHPTQLTGLVRESDHTGKHTTTARELISMPCGAWLIDTPGMRELKIGSISNSVSATFVDVESLARSCRFRDCTHQGDVGCAVAAAVASGALDARRLTNYMKLQREALRAARSVHERHEAERKFGRMHKAIKEQRRRKDPR
jgi:ribosome biogenesis GTPase